MKSIRHGHTRFLQHRRGSIFHVLETIPEWLKYHFNIEFGARPQHERTPDHLKLDRTDYRKIAVGILLVSLFFYVFIGAARYHAVHGPEKLDRIGFIDKPWELAAQWINDQHHNHQPQSHKTH